MNRIIKNPNRQLVIDLYNKGIKPKRIMIMTDINYNTIKYYIQEYRKGRI